MISFFEGFFEPLTGAFGVIIAAIAIVIGFLSLFFGRKFYWIFVAVAGFLLGLLFGPLLFANLDPAWIPWLTLILGVVFAALAVVFKAFMVSLGGAISLASVVYTLVQANLQQWIIVALTVVGAVIGFIIGWLVFEWGLIIFSSLTGASLVTSGVVSLIPSVANFDLIVFLALFLIGLIYQIVIWSRERAAEAALRAQTEDEVHEERLETEETA
ncbi:MAG: hypothetical protein SVR81_10325 [Chloroflexota bacterium]|nr:hypothetical protein [Chloroflexota bacterium]